MPPGTLGLQSDKQQPDALASQGVNGVKDKRSESDSDPLVLAKVAAILIHAGKRDPQIEVEGCGIVKRSIKKRATPDST